MAIIPALTGDAMTICPAGHYKFCHIYLKAGTGSLMVAWDGTTASNTNGKLLNLQTIHKFEGKEMLAKGVSIKSTSTSEVRYQLG